MGDINIDIVLHLSEYPLEGDETLVNVSSTQIGVSACNTAVTLAKLGLDTHLVGHIADNPLGQSVLSILSQSGLDHFLIQIGCDQTTGFITITVTSGGQRTL